MRLRHIRLSCESRACMLTCVHAGDTQHTPSSQSNIMVFSDPTLGNH